MDANVIEIPKTAMLYQPSKEERAKSLSFSQLMNMMSEENAIMKYTITLYAAFRNHSDAVALIELANCLHIKMMREVADSYFTNPKNSVNEDHS